jgi:glucose/arabinose dehydrogenase
MRFPFLIIYVLVAFASAQSGSTACSSISPSYPSPSLASGWTAQLVATNLTKPRSILFDGEGNLLVVQSGAGIVALALGGNEGCVTETSRTVVVDSTAVSVTLVEWFLG